MYFKDLLNCTCLGVKSLHHYFRVFKKNNPCSGCQISLLFLFRDANFSQRSTCLGAFWESRDEPDTPFGHWSAPPPPGQRLFVDYKSHFAQFGSKVMTRFQLVAHHFQFVMTGNKLIGYNLSGINANTD